MVKFLKKLGSIILGSGIITWLFILGIWTFVASRTSPELLPSPLTTWKGFLEILYNGVLFNDIKISMQRVFIGWFRGCLVAIPVGLLIGKFKIVRQLVEPFINFFRFVPAIGFLTLFLMWFGIGEESKLVLIEYAVFFPVTINTIAGVNSIDPVRYQAAESLGASRLQEFFTVTLPGAVPNIFTGIRLGLSTGIISIVGAEMLAASEGLGYLVYTSRLYYRTDWIFVGLVVLGILGFLIDKILRYFGNKIFRYYGVKNQ